ncbi:MAG: oligosaccharide flippase family protein [Candidatus Cloacimonadaceae bacterium]|nr:oligosaccharide flippase family protein [Candidatus Cloacimonadaceae bacterium]
MGYKANITSNLINQCIRIVLGLFTSIIVARSLGPQGQGYLAYIVLVFTLLGTYGHLGINNAVMYFQKRSGYDHDKLFRLNTGFLFLMFFVISVGVIVLRTAGVVLSEYSYYFIALGLIYVISQFLFENHLSWFIAEEQIVKSNRLNISVFLVKTAVILILWLTGMLNIRSFFAVTVMALLANALVLQIVLKKRMGFHWDRLLFKAEIKYGMVVYMGALFAFLHYRIDQIMIKVLLGTAELGVYTISVTLAELLFLIPISVTSALTGKLYNTEDKASGRMITARTVKLTLYVCAFFAVIGMAVSFLIPLIYGVAYQGAVISTIILLTGVTFASVAKVSAPYFFTQGRPVVHLIITFATLLLNGGLNLILIPRMGINGAALASSISYVCYGGYYLAVFVKVEKFTCRDLFQLSAADFKLFGKSKDAGL